MIILAYYPKYRTSAPTPANLPWSQITHLGYFSVAPTVTGGVVNTAGADLLTNMNSVVTNAHANNVKVLLVIGGASAASDATWRGAVSNTYRATFVNNIVNYVTTNNLDGVDIDWEPFATSSDATNFALFVAALRAALPRPTYFISMFVAILPAWKLSLCNSIQGDMDMFGLSTYDFSYGNSITVHDAPLYTSGSQPAGLSAHEAAQAYIAAGVSANKIGIGIEHYAPTWDSGNDLHVAGSYSGNAALYSALPGATATTPPTGEFYDSTAKAAYLKTPFRSYNNVASIEAKRDYVTANSLAGVIIWEIGQAYFSVGTPHFPLMEPFTGYTGGDQTAPVAGGGGTITTSGVDTTLTTLSWTKATDAVSDQAAIQYEVRRSNSNNIDTVANIEANGLVIKAYTADINTFQATGLTPATTYYYNVIAKDEAGNKVAYTMKSQLTATPPATNPLTMTGVSTITGLNRIT